ncbi:MAG: hypothetical protein JWO63_1290, partial [Frankiales bacterium]|nr:hypothetical protein [Frankiales bacterium]
DAPDARTACLQSGVAPEQLPVLARALASLAAGDTICPRLPAGPHATTEETE